MSYKALATAYSVEKLLGHPDRQEWRLEQI
jgi:hypothetical protein